MRLPRDRGAQGPRLHAAARVQPDLGSRGRGAPPPAATSGAYSNVLAPLASVGRFSTATDASQINEWQLQHLRRVTAKLPPSHPQAQLTLRAILVHQSRPLASSKT
eukprot:4251433-Prymnesium_polylepis.1